MLLRMNQIMNLKIAEALMSFGIIRIKNENEKLFKIDNQLNKFDLINVDFKVFSSKSFYYLIHRGNVDLIECLLENDNYLYANNFYSKIDKQLTIFFKNLCFENSQKEEKISIANAWNI
ncbi:hypothetical protein BpHYR1_022737 [Brachionus plicatilis]|uniref:Uncharacterized protein n=1 Tax=Brachionus plicatilis TaxID=10195 RepID=A0A3M7P355_BRAPC|nr:hypothetical protein BpHYR1_022737 [Brachionus plicatilis]